MTLAYLSNRELLIFACALLLIVVFWIAFRR